MHKRRLLVIPVVLFLTAIGFLSNSQSSPSAADQKVESFWSRWGKPPAELDRSKPLREQTRRISIGGHILDLPLMYLSYPLDEGEEQDGLALEMWLIDGQLRAIPELPREMVRDRKNWGKSSISVLVLPLPDPDREIADMVDTFLASSEPEHIGRSYSLEEYKLVSKKMEVHNNDLFVEQRDEGQKESLIICRAEYAVPVPRCNHTLQIDNLQYQIRYRKVHLPDWQEIRANVLALISSFESTDSPYFQTNIKGE